MLLLHFKIYLYKCYSLLQDQCLLSCFDPLSGGSKWDQQVFMYIVFPGISLILVVVFVGTP